MHLFTKKITKLLVIILIAAISLFTSCSQDPFLSTVDESRKLAIEWIENNFRDKGLWYYIYKPKEDSHPNSNNALRQLMASRLVAELAQTDQKFADIHRQNLQFIFKNWYSEISNRGYIYYNSKSKLGANAMLLRTLSFSPFFNEYQIQAKNTANGIVSLINEDGSLEPWFIAPDYEFDKNYLLTFYSGEAILSLLDYYQRSGDDDILKAAKKAQDYYLKEYVEKINNNYYPAYVPWHTQSLSKLYKITGDQKYADAIFLLNDKVLELLDRTNNIGRFYNPNTPQYGTPHVASDAVYTESLAYALEIAKLTNDKQHERLYRKAITLAVQNLTNLQYCYNKQEHFSYDTKKTCGAFHYHINDSRIRIDNVQHAIDAFTKIKEVW